MELEALSAITSALESHSVFEGGGDEDVLPAMLFGLATPLLLHNKEKQQQQQQLSPLPTPPQKNEGAEKGGTPPVASSKIQDTSDTAIAITTTTKVDKEVFRAARQRLAEAFLRLLAERREWVARSLAMAANASPTDLSGGAAAPAPVTINNLLVNSLAHPDLLGAFTAKAPVRLRAQAVASARKCEADSTFAPGFAQQLAGLMGLGGQQEKNRRMAGMAMDKMAKKEASKAAAVKCARLACGKRQGSGSEGSKFKVCSRCQTAMYCSGECQTTHWKEGHKGECKRK